MNNFQPKFMLHGADYNYEQWLDYPDVLNQDFQLMKLAHCNAMSVGIFSWSMLEPTEGKYTFGWLDRLMDRLAENRIAAILATPSGAKPAWMAQKYPEIRQMDENGHRQPQRLRHNHCPSSPIYREKVNQINTLLAERYADHPALLMWHVSNEYNFSKCQCDLCLQAFQEWLKARYGSLDALNKAWWTTFWSHRYSDWSQIEPVDPTLHGLMLDWMRFVSDQVLDFYLAEIEPLRKITPDIPVTTNFMQPDVGLDYWKFAQYVDIVAWDSYPRWYSDPDDRAIAAKTAFYHDFFRSLKQRPFLQIESTPSVTNWQGISRPKRPGLHKLAALQVIAHGGNGVQYFQWRQSRGGEEKFHGAVVSHAGHENTRTFREVAAVGETLAQMNEIIDSVNQAEVAIVYDPQNEWALNMAQLPRSLDKNYQERCIAHYLPFWQRGITVDIMNSTFSDIGKYKIVIAPMLYMLQEGAAERLADFVKAGGTLITTYLSGLVDSNDLVFLGGAPGPLKELLGLWVEETDSLFSHNKQAIKPTAITLPDPLYSVREYADVVHLQGAQALAVYEQDFYAGSPAITVNQFGQGIAYYLAARAEDGFLDDFYGWLGSELGLQTAVQNELPRGVTAQVRQSDTEETLFLLNFTPQDQTFNLGEPAVKDFFTGEAVNGEILLEGTSFRVFKRDKN